MTGMVVANMSAFPDSGTQATIHYFLAMTAEEILCEFSG